MAEQQKKVWDVQVIGINFVLTIVSAGIINLAASFFSGRDESLKEIAKIVKEDHEEVIRIKAYMDLATPIRDKEIEGIRETNKRQDADIKDIQDELKHKR